MQQPTNKIIKNATTTIQNNELSLYKSRTDKWNPFTQSKLLDTNCSLLGFCFNIDKMLIKRYLHVQCE